YSNLGYQLLAYALETIKGRKFSDMLESNLKKLGLNHTYYLVPPRNLGVIPPGNDGGWNFSLGEASPTGNMYSSISDISSLGRAIFRNSVLTAAQTRRWLRPAATTADIYEGVSYPWGYRRIPLGPPGSSLMNRIVDSYNKAGSINKYASLLILLPDYDVGFSALLAGGWPGNANWDIADTIGPILLPALEAAAREQADEIFAGTYTAESGLNSSLTLSTDPEKPGIGVDRWVSNGTDMIPVAIHYTLTTTVHDRRRRESRKRGAIGVEDTAFALTNDRLPSGLQTWATYIVPGARWRDTEGNIIHAYAGNVVFDQGTFWLFGEYKTEGQGEGGGVAVYSSKDLGIWQSHGLALKPIEGHPYISPGMIIQRPKVVYSEPTGKYHGFASSDKIEGPYDFIDATSPLGNWSQDFGLFTDWRDGRSYALYSNGDSKEGRDVYLTSYNKEVSALDEVDLEISTDALYSEKYDLEAPTIIQTDKSYYALMSHKTGYRPNNVVAFRADKLSGPWSQPFIVFPLNTRSFNSQSGFTLRIQGSKKTSYLYLGDRWDGNSIWESRHIWLPIDAIDERKTLEVKWYDVYDLNVQTGEWSAVKGQTYGQKYATPNGDAFKQEANFADDGTIITGIYGNDSTVTFHGIEGTGKPQWVSFYYQNTDDMGYGDQRGAWQLRRISSVIVNGDTENVETLYQVDTHKGIILSTPLQLTLKKGRQNTITVGGLFNGFDYKGADLEKIVVYPPEK
ncbi:hypothetical protein CIB48_g6614, partial [Xylaria polymorpha]